MHRPIYKTVPFLLMMSAVISCTEISPEPAEDIVDYGFSIVGTKAGSATSTTYRAMLHNTGGSEGEYPYSGKSGTYRGPATDGRAWLTACEVYPTTGVWVRDSSLYGLRAFSKAYYLSFVSPAVAPQQYKWNSTTKKYEEWGFFHHRDPIPGEPELFISSPIYISSLTGNHLQGQYVYDVPDDVVLKERRCKVTLKIKCGDDLLSVSVKKVGWSNLYESAYYNLRLDTLDTFTLAPPTDTVFVCETPFTVNKGDPAVTLDSTIFLFPLAYSARSGDTYIYKTPEINFYVAQGVAKLTVYKNMSSQYDYTYTITINSAYASVDVTAAPWDTPSGDKNGTITDTPSYTFTLPPALWDDHSGINGAIN